MPGNGVHRSVTRGRGWGTVCCHPRPVHGTMDDVFGVLLGHVGLLLPWRFFIGTEGWEQSVAALDFFTMCPVCSQGGHWGFTKYGPHPHRMAKNGPIFIFSTVLASSKKIFANSVERKTPGILQSIVI